MRGPLPYAHRRYHAYRCCLALMDRLGRSPTGAELSNEMGVSIGRGTSRGAWLRELRLAQKNGLPFPFSIEDGRGSDDEREARSNRRQKQAAEKRKDEYMLPVDELMGAE